MRVAVFLVLFLYICAIDATTPAFQHYTYSPDHNVFGVGTQTIRIICEYSSTVITNKVLFLVDDTASDCASASNWKVGGSIGSFVVLNPSYYLDVTIPNINATGCWKMVFYTATASYDFESYKFLQDNSRSYGRVLPPVLLPSVAHVPFSVANDPQQGFPVRFSNINSNDTSLNFYLPNSDSPIPANCSLTPNVDQQFTCFVPVPLDSPTQVGYLEATLSVLGLTTNRTVVATLYKHVSSLKPQIAFIGVPTRISVRGPSIQSSDKYILTSAASCSAAAVNSAFPASAGSAPLVFNSKSDIRGCFCKYVVGVTDCTQIAHFVETGPLGTLYVRDSSTIITDINPKAMTMPASSIFTFSLSVPLFPSIFVWFGGVAAQSDAQSDPITSFLGQLPANVSALDKMMAVNQASLVPNLPSVSTKGPFAVVPGHLTCAGASIYSTMSAPGRLSFLDIQKVSFKFGTDLFKPNAYPEELSYCVCFENCDQDSSWAVQASMPQIEATQAPFLDTVGPIVPAGQGQAQQVTFTGNFPLYPMDNLGIALMTPAGDFDEYNSAWPMSNDDGGPQMLVQFEQMPWAWVDIWISDWTNWPAQKDGNVVRVYTTLPVADSVQAQFGSSTLTITGRNFSISASQSAVYFAPESRYSGTCTVTIATRKLLSASCTQPFDRIMRYKLWVEDTRCATPLDGPNGRKYAFLEFPPQASVITSISPTQVTVGSGNVSINLSGSNANEGYITFVTLDHTCYDSFSSFTPRPLPIVNSAVNVWPRMVGQYQLCYCSATASDCNSSTNYFAVGTIRLTVRMGSNVATSLQEPSTLPPTSFNGQAATILLSSLLPQDLRCAAQGSSLTPSLPPLTFWTRNSTQCDLPSQFWLPYTLCNATNSGALMIPAPGALGDVQVGLYRLCMCIGECKTPGDFAIQSGVSVSVVSPGTIWESTYTPQLTSFHPNSPFRISLTLTDPTSATTSVYTCELNSAAGGAGLVLTAGRVSKKGKFVLCSDWRGTLYKPQVSWTLVVKENGSPLKPPSAAPVFQSLPFVDFSRLN